MTTVEERLFFNGDETDLNRKGGAPKFVVSENDARVIFVTKDYSGNHVSIFFVVSAADNPCILLRYSMVLR